MNAPKTGKTYRVALVSFLNQHHDISIKPMADFLASRGKDVVKIYMDGGNHDNILCPEGGEVKEEYIAQLIKLLDELEIDLLGFGIMTRTYESAIQIVTALRGRVDCPIVFGGWHPTLSPEDCIEYCDVVCIGEGEETMLELIETLEEGKSLSAVNGIWWKDAGTVVKNQQRAVIGNLDAVYETLTFVDEKNYHIGLPKIPADQLTEYYTITSKGCPYKCTYCSSPNLNKIFPGYIRKRTLPNILAELVAAKKCYPNLKLIYFWNEVFLYHGKDLDEFCEQYSKLVAIPFFTYLHISACKKEDLVKLKKAGMIALHVGLQSASQRFRKEIYDRHETDDAVQYITDGAFDTGLKVCVDLICAPDLETAQDIKESIQLILKLNKNIRYRFSNILYLPKTRLKVLALEKGYIDEAYRLNWHWQSYGVTSINIFSAKNYFYHLMFLAAKTDINQEKCLHLSAQHTPLRAAYVIGLAYYYCLVNNWRSACRLRQSLKAKIRQAFDFTILRENWNLDNREDTDVDAYYSNRRMTL